jgi:hypothetical protein
MILLLDQSYSMEDEFGGQQIGAGKKKKDMVATILNSFLHELVETNTVGAEVKPRVDIAVLGYHGNMVDSALSGPLASKPFVSLPDLKNNTVRVDVRERKEMDDTGNIVEIPVFFPIWVEPVADGGTPMQMALTRARELAEQWVASHPDNYPPVVINVTDGMATDVHDLDDLFPIVQELRQVSTSDGQTLLFNCHISEAAGNKVEFPANESEVSGADEYAQLMFSLSSEIPDTARNSIKQAYGRDLPIGTRGFIFNGDAVSVKDMFTFASTQARKIDPNR